MCISLRFTQLKSVVKNNRKVKVKNPLTAVKSLIHPQVLYFFKKKKYHKHHGNGIYDDSYFCRKLILKFFYIQKIQYHLCKYQVDGG